MSAASLAFVKPMNQTVALLVTLLPAMLLGGALGTQHHWGLKALGALLIGFGGWGFWRSQGPGGPHNPQIDREFPWFAQRAAWWRARPVLSQVLTFVMTTALCFVTFLCWR